jgi:hypothetical protein
MGGQGPLAIDTAITEPVLNFDWPAIETGTATYEAGPTGVTVIRFPKRAIGVIDVRGGAPGTYITPMRYVLAIRTDGSTGSCLPAVPAAVSKQLPGLQRH